MVSIDRFRPRPGQIRAHLFQNLELGLAPTLFYDITIPLEPFDSGLEWEEQPVHTEFRLEFVQLPVRDWRDLDGKSFEMTPGDADMYGSAQPRDGGELTRVDGPTSPCLRTTQLSVRSDREGLHPFSGPADRREATGPRRGKG